MKKLIPILALALIALTAVQLWVTKDRTGQKKALEQEAGEGQADIGGDFTLTNQDGKTVHASDFRGRLMLVYFGFTHCPDICPVTVATMSKAMDLLGTQADQVAPIFITVDPARDTPSVLKDYLSNFDKHMIGLTGTPQQIKQVAGEYKAYYARRDVPWAAESSSGHDKTAARDNYTVDHSGFIYLMNKDGSYVRLFPYNAKAEEIAHAIEHFLR